MESVAAWAGPLLSVLTLASIVIGGRVLLRDLGAPLGHLPDILRDIAHTTATDSGNPTDPDVVARMEALERRMEALQDEALTYLRRGSTALARAKKLRGEDDDDDDEPTELTPEQIAERDQMRLSLEGAPTAAPAADPVMAHRLRRYRDPQNGR